MIRVIRGGRRVEVSIYDLVVGDVVPLNIGDQVPAGGILIMGHSLAIDESSMTGDHNTMSLYACYVRKDSRQSFLMSSCKVVDGYGSMLVKIQISLFSFFHACNYFPFFPQVHCLKSYKVISRLLKAA
ncbi:hypothetical protein GBA52_026371 [Prunus armeniaca]|nr:hypothetical protein GBA52_026371 [Prunus armeniaca]